MVTWRRETGQILACMHIETRNLQSYPIFIRLSPLRRAVVLEMIGDLPEADSKPPTNMLFVCKLNPVRAVPLL